MVQVVREMMGNSSQYVFANQWPKHVPISVPDCEPLSNKSSNNFVLVIVKTAPYRIEVQIIVVYLCIL